ncbi:MAG: hypothetical protein ABI885_13665 [Gammaproteobacteria bacterium]
MRLFYIALVGPLVAALGACAGSPPVRTASTEAAAPVARSAPAMPADAVVERQVKVDATNIVEVQKAGYKIVNEDGKTLYCRRDLNTGSHLRSTTTCLTETELNEALERSRAGVEDMARHRLPPHQGP